MPFITLKAVFESTALLFFSHALMLFLFARRMLCSRHLSLTALCVIWLGSAEAALKSLGSAELEKELSQYKKIKSLEASFEQVKNLKGLQIVLKSSGFFRLQKQDRESAVVEWQVNKPSYMKLRITSGSIELFEKEGEPGKPLLENKEAQSKILGPLFAWLSVNSRLIGEQYSIFSEGKKKFRLEPKEAGSPVRALVLQLDNRKFVKSVLLEERSGDELRISFSAIKSDLFP